MKREIILDELIPTLAISIGTSYKINSDKKIKLVNIIYIPKAKKVSYNDNIHLSKNIQNLLDGKLYNADSKKYLEKYQIFSISKWNKFIDKNKMYEILNLDNNELYNKITNEEKINEEEPRKYTTIKSYSSDDISNLKQYYDENLFAIKDSSFGFTKIKRK